MAPQPPSPTTFLIIPLILNSMYAPAPLQTRAPMANAPEPIVYQLSNTQRRDDLDSSQFSWLPPAGLCSGHFGIANTTESSSSVLLLLLVSLPDMQGDLPARHGHRRHLGSNNTNSTKVPWTSLPLEPGTYGVPRLGREPVDRFGLNFSLDVGLYSLSDSSSLFPTPPMTMSEQVGPGLGEPALFGVVLCRGDGFGSFIPAPAGFFQDEPHHRIHRSEASTYRERASAAQAQPRKLLGVDTRNFHGHPTPVHTYYTAAAIAICSALLALVVCTLVWCLRSLLQDRDDETSIRLQLPDDDLCPAGPRRYSHLELAAATGGFPDGGMIGRGGFGPVYRGYLRDHGCHAAIKVLLSTSMQAQGIREFQAEVKVMTRLRHRNIVQLLGWSWSDDGPGRLMLAYELLPNGSLDNRLHNPQGPLLSWADRYKIALGVGSAILYLHTECEQCVLHGDIKPANILLDASCDAKLGDFGLARLVDHGTDSRTTQAVAGTPGYMDPELVNNGRPSAEADVFSFGVVLLELASGRRPLTAAQQPNTLLLLIDWVRDMYRKNTILGAADRRLDGEFDHQQMRRVLVAGLWCTHHDRSRRPPIAQAMDLLRRQGAELPVLAEMHSPATAASVRSLEETAYGDLDSSAEDSAFEDSSADTAYHTSEGSTFAC